MTAAAPGRVQVLPAALANQIAAGEVVERPSSVVKELVENALDAGATTVFVDIEDGGRRLIRVVDDGCGMTRGDATLAMQRHATSKIRSTEDLHAIHTLGFRGEALPSIASVCRFHMVTRSAGDEVGTEVRVDGGGPVEVRGAGGRVGTRIEVRDLFHNIPARLKFLKRNATEMSHVHGLITSAALGYPHVHFRISHNGRVSADHPVAPSLKQRIYQVLGARTTQHLYEVELSEPFRVRGFLSEPTFTRTNAAGIHTFINGRWVRDKLVNHAVVSAYGNLLDRGRYPYAVLYLHLPPGEVDVNVHPAKAEVRFVRSGPVHEAIVRACRITLSSTPWVRAHASSGVPARDSAARTPLPMDVMGLAHARGGAPPVPPVPGVPTVPPAPPPLAVPGSLRLPQELVLEPEDGRWFSRMRPVGQIGRTYLVCEGHGAMHIIDQHAAHERVGYERIKAGFCASRLSRQQLLIPLQLELSASEASAVEDHLEVLARLGFDLEHFGGRTWQIMSVPALLATAGVERLVRDVVGELGEYGAASLAESELDMLFSTMACHSVVRAGDTLNREEIRALLAAMDEVDLGASCPHGRPVVISTPLAELARRFHRS